MSDGLARTLLPARCLWKRLMWRKSEVAQGIEYRNFPGLVLNDPSVSSLELSETMVNSAGVRIGMALIMCLPLALEKVLPKGEVQLYRVC